MLQPPTNVHMLYAMIESVILHKAPSVHVRTVRINTTASTDPCSGNAQEAIDNIVHVDLQRRLIVDYRACPIYQPSALAIDMLWVESALGR